jgi:hypothetical protein
MIGRICHPDVSVANGIGASHSGVGASYAVQLMAKCFRGFQRYPY